MLSLHWFFSDYSMIIYAAPSNGTCNVQRHAFTLYVFIVSREHSMLMFWSHCSAAVMMWSTDQWSASWVSCITHKRQQGSSSCRLSYRPWLLCFWEPPQDLSSACNPGDRSTCYSSVAGTAQYCWTTLALWSRVKWNEDFFAEDGSASTLYQHEDNCARKGF